jgi:GH25 family lysozyme M1 (1,4-beta-N-acetylmuramidase)
MRLCVSPIRGPRRFLVRSAAAAGLVATLTVTGAGIAAAGVIGPDVSSYNHVGGSTLDWGAVHNVGRASFVFIKATEGGGYTNPAFAADFAAAGQNGLVRGAYDFARPSGGTGTWRDIFVNAVAEANQFGQTVGTLAGPGNLPPVLDLEDAGNLNSAQLTVWVQAWLDQAKKLTGRTPILYTNPGFWKQNMGDSGAFTAYPLWLAHYGVPTPELVGGWKSFTFWQFTDSARIEGASASLDMSMFNGSVADLMAMTVSPTGAAAAAAAAASAVAASAAAASAAAAAAVATDAAASAATTRTRIYTTLNLQSLAAARTDMTSSRAGLRAWMSTSGLNGGSYFLGH